MRIRTTRLGTTLKARSRTRKYSPSGMVLGAVAAVVLVGVAWLPTVQLKRPQIRLAPANYSMPHKNAAQTEETPATIKRAPVPVRPDPGETIRVDFSSTGGAPGRAPIKGKRS